MKKSLIALVVASSFVLAGCSSSSGTDAGTESTPQRPAPVDPEFGIDTTPSWGVDTTPDWGQPPVQPPIDDTPDWGGIAPPPVQPPIDNNPDRPEPDYGDTPGWGGENGDIQIDHNGVVYFNGEQYQYTGYDEMGQEFLFVDKEGVEFFARYDEGMLKVTYKQKVYVFNGHRFVFTPDFDFGVDTTPDWGVTPPPIQPPLDNSPERPQPDFGDTPEWGGDIADTPDRLPPTWGGECGSPDGGASCAPIPPKPPTDVDNDWGVNPPEVSPAINNIDRNKVRDAVRTRLNG